MSSVRVVFFACLPWFSVSEVAPPTSGEDLKIHYYDIFKTGNRNAASHLWSSYILNSTHLMPEDTIEKVFRGFCPVSGSPLPDDPHTAYRIKLPKVTGGTVTGVSHHCCWPCICDLFELVRVDQKTIKTANGDRSYDFFVIGDPCKNEAKLDKMFTDPFTQQPVSLRDEAPELKCQNGRLAGAHFSDNGYVIIGMFFTSSTDISQAEQNHPPQAVNPADPTFGFSSMCQVRKKNGYNSGMGLIFHLVANINPISTAEKLKLPTLNMNELPADAAGSHPVISKMNTTSNVFSYLCSGALVVVAVAFVTHRVRKCRDRTKATEETTFDLGEEVLE